MEKYKTVRLGDVCEIVMGTSPEGKTISQNSSAGIEFHQGKTCFGNLYLNESGMFTNSPIRFADAGNVIMSVRAPVGDSNITPRKIAIGRGLCTFNTKNNFEKLFLYYYLNSQIDFLRLQSTGSTFKAVNKDVISDLQIPLPPLQEQKQIAAILDKCTELIAKNKLMLEKYDTLIKSRFIEMFGDPVQNPMGWEKTELGNMCKEVRYGTSKPAIENGKYTYLRMNNITFEGELDLANTKTIDISDEELPKCSVQKGDILFNRTNSIELCGKTCLYKLDETMVIAGYIIRVRVNEKLNPQYVSTFFNTKSIKKLLKEMAKGAVNQANINAQEMQSIQIPVPPITLQNEYDSFVQQIDKSKFAVQKSLEKAETLYKSLMQEYFG
ncbi:MAG: restriction endonuclease subunit S [Spirochaetaceae bacterium]|nr:restriction endonuclease subunit S [Spirochaetaceae bacterium]